MESPNQKIVDLLLECEEKGFAPKYIVYQETYCCEDSQSKKSVPKPVPPVEYKCENEEEIFVISDLHISSGRDNSGSYPGTENFFADESFARFLNYADKKKEHGKKGILIINGDVLDFLRVTEYPGKTDKYTWSRQLSRLMSGKSFLKLSQKALERIAQCKIEEEEEWQNILKKLGLEIDYKDLDKKRKSEQKYGLGTNNYKSIWKLNLIKNGHLIFFQALADWIKKGNKIFIVKGNHDLEWYFYSVRNYFRLLMGELISGGYNDDLENTLRMQVLPNIHFFDNSVLIDDDFYIEHGHRYDKFTFVLKNPLLIDSQEVKPQNLQNKSDELNIPFGSFFNRYLINRIELLFPYADNIRPASNILPIMLKEKLSVALKLIAQSIFLIGRILRTLKGKYIVFMFNRVGFLLVIPLLVWYALKNDCVRQFLFDVKPNSSRFTDFGAGIVESIIFFALSYLLARMITHFQLSEPESLVNDAIEVFKRNKKYRIITMGHTHNPSEYKLSDGQWFYNTGTWIPIVEASAAEIRENKTYTFLHLVRCDDNKLYPANDGLLQRWNDDAGRGEPIVITQRK